MRIVRHLQHWLGGSGPRIGVVDFVPEDHPIRQWSDTFPWSEMVYAIDESIARRFPKQTHRGQIGHFIIAHGIRLELLSRALRSKWPSLARLAGERDFAIEICA